MGGMVVIVLMALIILMAFLAWAMTQTPKTPKAELRDDPMYRKAVSIIREVAYYNQALSPGWTDVVPKELENKAQAFLIDHRKELGS